ncbi:glycosyltransferase family 4 protein [Mucilaginibacter sp.]|uniref:glycosyltransferase family 4 protein n=1 Tax=Mucilaginibacter sp. TaxID=1882438 RepID=UPI003562747E
MKIVILNNDFRVYWKSRLLFLHQYLAAQNIDMYAIELFGKGSPYAFDTVNNTQSWWTCLLPHHGSADLSKFDIRKALYTALDDLQPDIIIGPSIVFFPGALGISWAKRNNKKFIMFDDAKPSQVKRNFIVQWVKDLITSQVDSLWLPSKSYNHEYAYFHKKGIPFFYGFSCIDNDFFNSSVSYQPESKTIICVARLVPIKNIDNLLRAWQLIERQNTGYHLIIVGNGPQGMYLKKLSSDLGVKTVEFIDAVDNKALPAYYQRSGAFVLPSLSETWGLVVNEAMAAGLPVLLSARINAAADLLQEGINGFGFDPVDVNAIYNAILRYINTDGLSKAAMSTASLKFIDAFSFKRMGEQLVDELNQLYVKPYTSPGIIAATIINLWYGRYNTAGWDKIDNNKS